MEDFIIPIDDAIDDFFNHMKANPRTVLSSKFGDGKSFFLEKFKKNKDVMEHFAILSIYPVNYQVASNEDIFKLIKRDILYQLMLNEMISNNVIIPKDIVLWFYLQNNKYSLVADLMEHLSSIGIANENISPIITSIKSIKLFKDVKQKVDDFAHKYSDEQLLDDFLKSADSKTIYEEDVITAIIKRAIKDYKNRTHKEVVLIVEDLDRIDPAHLFRILNVFSAHMDYCYKCFEKPTPTSLIGNKFELDNIVLVADFSNIRKIFKHFYGEETDFNGYIGKFLSSKPFSYSLREERYKYIYNRLSSITGGPVSLLKIMMPEESIAYKTIREIVHAFEIEKQVKEVIIVSKDNKEVLLCPVFVKILAVMIRLGFNEDEMKKLPLKIFQQAENLFFEFVAPYILLSNKDETDLSVFIYKREGSYQTMYKIRCKIDERTGKGQRCQMYDNGNDNADNHFSSIVDNVLKYICK